MKGVKSGRWVWQIVGKLAETRSLCVWPIPSHTDGIFSRSSAPFRLVHHPSLYKSIHKIHHEWTAPVGVVALYAHPVEHVVRSWLWCGHVTRTVSLCWNPLICVQLSNMLPALAGPILLGSHVATTSLWFTIALLVTTVSHCGYHLPLLPSPEFHDFHHLK